jgi:hypothetical protein
MKDLLAPVVVSVTGISVSAQSGRLASEDNLSDD